MSTDCCMEMLNHYVVHPKIILHCILTNWKLNKNFRGTWVAQLVKHPTLAQVMISRFMGSSPMLGSMLTAQSLEPASDSVSAPPPLVLCLSSSQKKT